MCSAEHILLGLIREGEGVAAQVLVRLGADLNRVRQQVIQLLHGPDTITAATDLPQPGDGAGRERRGPLLVDVLRRLRLIESRLDVLEGHGSDVREASEENERLRDLLRQHGIDPEDGTA
jgi:ATP-dependent Clp protease ATP-binding subunit ClpA